MGKERLFKIAGFGTIVASLSTLAFSVSDRRGVESRDRGKCKLCGSNNTIVAHHIVPECLENGNNGTYIYTDDYVRPLYLLYQSIISMLPPNKIESIRKKVKSIIHSKANGIALCSTCHRDLHSGRLENSKLKVNNYDNLKLPPSLKTGDVMAFFIDEIVNPALKQVSLPSLAVDQSGALSFSYSSSR